MNIPDHTPWFPPGFILNPEPITPEVFERLQQMFIGKKVRITDEAPHTLKRELIGICQTLHLTPRGVDMELTDGRRVGFYPEKITHTSIKCDLRREAIAKIRTIEITEE